MVAIDRSMHGSLRDEVQLLRRKVVKLETAEADNGRLRKELSRVQKSSEDKKAEMELDFMNQLSRAARENALKIEEMEGRLNESNNVNRALSEQLASCETLDSLKKKLNEAEAKHKQELATVIDNNKEEIERLQNQVKIVQTTRDELTGKLDDTRLNLDMKQRKVEALEAKLKSVSGSPSATGASVVVSSGSDEEILKENKKLTAEVKSLKLEISKKSKMLESENKIMQERLASRDSEIKTKTSEIRRLNSELERERKQRVSASAVVSKPAGEKSSVLRKLETENSRLKSTLQNSETESKKATERLERTNTDLREKCRKLEQENSDLKRAQEDLTKKLSTKDDSSVHATPSSTSSVSSDTSASAHQKRTSQIIKKLEQNLKREGQAKQSVTAGLKSRAQVFERSADNASSQAAAAGDDEQLARLTAEVQDLKQKLQQQKDLTSSLRREINDKQSAQKKATSTASSVSKIPSTKVSSSYPDKGRDRVSLTTKKPAVVDLSVVTANREVTSPSKPAVTKSKPTNGGKKGPRTPVKGLVQNFERRISNGPVSQGAPWEIDSPVTSKPAPVVIPSGTHRRGMSFPPDDEIEELKNSLRHEKRQVAELEEELTRQCEINCALVKEISALSSETETNRSKQAESHENKWKTDQNEMDRLKLKTRQLQKQVEEAQETIENLQQKTPPPSPRILLETKRKVEELEAELSRVNELKARSEDELAKSKDEIAQCKDEIAKRKAEISSLKSAVEELKATKVVAAQTKAALEKEKEAAGQLDALVQDLKSQLLVAEEKCGKLSKEREERSMVDKDEIGLLRTQVESLSADLGKVKEERDELEFNDQVHHRKFETLQKEVEKKVAEFEQIHGADKEAIGRLHEQVTALQQELSDTMTVVDQLKDKLKEKEKVEETVEELARQNQHSLDSQINKLRTELTRTYVEKNATEADHKKKIQGLEDMIDSLHAEMDESLDEKEREVSTLKRQIGDKESVVTRLTREKEQLVLSMNDMTSSRRDEIEELQSELMEMSTRAANQAREVQALKLQLEESSYRKEEVERLRYRVRELNDQLESRDGARAEETIALEVENSELRQRLRQTSLERQSAEDRLRDYVNEQSGNSSKSLQVLRERNAALKFEVEKLTKKLRKLGDKRPDESKSSPANVEATRFMI